MEKLTGPKHNHLLTDLVKVCIFSLMLLLPFLCFIPTGFYYGFNEHATNETTTEINYKYQSNEVNTLDDLVEGNIYYLDEWTTNYDSMPEYYDLLVISLYSYDSNNLELQGIDESLLQEYNSNNFNQLIFSFNEENVFIQYTNDNAYVSLHFEFVDITFNEIVFVFNGDYLPFSNDGVLPQYTDYNVIESVETNVQDTISNKMYLAWQGVWTSPLFNWTNNTPLNTGLNGFVSIFGINQSSYIANCLIYLLSITAIYVVFDIVLGIFKWLTHLINK